MKSKKKKVVCQVCLKKRRPRKKKIRKIVVPPPEVNVYYPKSGPESYAYLSNISPQNVDTNISFHSEAVFSGKITPASSQSEVLLKEAGNYFVNFMIRAKEVNRVGLALNNETIKESVYASNADGFNMGQFIFNSGENTNIKLVNVTGKSFNLRDDGTVNASVTIQKMN